MAGRKGGPVPPARDYEVGYGKPPKATRWAAGFCPNPKGRPKKAHTVSAIIDRLLDSKIRLRDDTGGRQVTRFEYLLMRAADRAGKGDLPSLKFLVEMRARYPSITPESAETNEIGADDDALIEAYLKRRITDDIEP